MNRLLTCVQQAMLLMLPVIVLIAGVAAVFPPATFALAIPAWLLLAAAFAPLLTGIVLRWRLPGVDLTLVTCCGMLASIGAATMVRISALPGAGQPFFETVATRHLAFVVASFGAMLFGAYLARYLASARRYPYVTAVVATGLIVSTMLIGTEVNGAKLWIVVGSLRLQPAEVARVLLVLFVAGYLYDRRNLVASPWRLGWLALPPIPYLMPLAAALGIALAALAVQNDLGMAALTAIGAFAVIATSLRSRWSVASIGASVALAIWAGTALSPRVQARVGSWIDPWVSPMTTGYQFVQSDYALSSGGISGSPLLPDVRNVPEVQTDFVLAAIGSQSGLAVSAAVLAILTIIVLRCAGNALRGSTDAEQHVGVALTVLLGAQTLLILGGVLRLLPLTGLTVPLVSYGGTSLVVTGLTIGLILGVGARGHRQAAY